MMEPYFRQLETQLLEVIGQVPARVTRRTAAFLQAGTDAVLDVTVSATESQGHMVAREQVTVEIRLRAAVRDTASDRAVDLARFLVDYARYRVATSGHTAVAHVDATTYQEDIDIDSGKPLVVHQAVLRSRVTFDGAAPYLDGIVLAATADGFTPVEAKATVILEQPVAMIDLSSGFAIEPATVQVFYAGTSPSASIELVMDADGYPAVASQPADAFGKAVFPGVQAGEYRAAVNTGAERHITATIITIIGAP